MNTTVLPHAAITVGSSITQHSAFFSALGRASAVLSETAKKIAFISSIYLMKAAAVTQTALIGAWSVTKTYGYNAAEIAKRIGNGLLASFHFVADKSVQLSQVAKKGMIIAGNYLFKAALITKSGLHTGWVAAKNFGGKTLEVAKNVAIAIFSLLKKIGNQVAHISQKVVQVAAICFLKAAHFTAQGCSIAKVGLIQGFKTSKLFFATHQKETVLVGCGLAIGAGVFYAAERLFSGFKKGFKEAETQTV